MRVPWQRVALVEFFPILALLSETCAEFIRPLRYRRRYFT